MGEYALAWAACQCNEGVYNLLLAKGANPDAKDRFGNTIMHMVVVANQMGMFGYALRHPIGKRPQKYQFGLHKNTG